MSEYNKRLETWRVMIRQYNLQLKVNMRKVEDYNNVIHNVFTHWLNLPGPAPKVWRVCSLPGDDNFIIAQRDLGSFQGAQQFARDMYRDLTQ